MKYQDPLAQDPEPLSSSLMPSAGMAAGAGALATGAVLGLSPTARKFAKTNLLDPLNSVTEPYTKPVMQFFRGLGTLPGPKQAVQGVKAAMEGSTDLGKKIMDNGAQVEALAAVKPATTLAGGRKIGEARADLYFGNSPHNKDKWQAIPYSDVRDAAGALADFVKDPKMLVGGRSKLSLNDKAVLAKMAEAGVIDPAELPVAEKFMHLLKAKQGLNSKVDAKFQMDEFAKLYKGITAGG